MVRSGRRLQEEYEAFVSTQQTKVHDNHSWQQRQMPQTYQDSKRLLHNQDHCSADSLLKMTFARYFLWSTESAEKVSPSHLPW
jgi:hypothetical protein